MVSERPRSCASPRRPGALPPELVEQACCRDAAENGDLGFFDLPRPGPSTPEPAWARRAVGEGDEVLPESRMREICMAIGNPPVRRAGVPTPFDAPSGRCAPG